MNILSSRDIHAALSKFCEDRMNTDLGIMPGYEFAHVVLDDLNLSDEHIRWCLERAAQWEQERLDALPSKYPDDPLMRAAEKLAVNKYKDDVILVLSWLLTVPDEVRVYAEYIDGVFLTDGGKEEEVTCEHSHPFPC